MTDWTKEAQRVAESSFLGKGPGTPSIIEAIATALREAHRKGEEEMRERAAVTARDYPASAVGLYIAQAIRSLPLSGGGSEGDR